jgi:hypothetical protein
MSVSASGQYLSQNNPLRNLMIGVARKVAAASTKKRANALRNAGSGINAYTKMALKGLNSFGKIGSQYKAAKKSYKGKGINSYTKMALKALGSAEKLGKQYKATKKSMKGKGLQMFNMYVAQEWPSRYIKGFVEPKVLMKELAAEWKAMSAKEKHKQFDSWKGYKLGLLNKRQRSSARFLKRFDLVKGLLEGKRNPYGSSRAAMVKALKRKSSPKKSKKSALERALAKLAKI